MEPLLLVDDNTIDPTMARLRVVHTSPNAGPVDVSVDGLGTVLSNFNFKDVSPYLSVGPGSNNVRIFEAGTTHEVFAVNDQALDAGWVYSAFAIGLVGDPTTPFAVLPTVDAVPKLPRNSACSAPSPA